MILARHVAPVGRFWLGRVPIDPLTREAALEAIAELVASRSGGTVFTPNVDHVVLAEADAAFRAGYAQASLSLIDGVPVLWAGRLSGRSGLVKTSGSDLILPLAARAAASGWRLYFLGGGPGVGEKAAALLRALHADLVIAGIDSSTIDMSGPATARAEVVRRAQQADADLIFVALGSPKGELWAAEARDALSPAVLVAIGAGLDFLVGAQKRAPAWMSRMGLEWLFRLTREPRRLWRRYLVRGPRFVPIAARSILRSRWRSEQTGSP